MLRSLPRRFVAMDDDMNKPQVYSGSEPYNVLLYYAFVPIEDPEAFANNHRQLCLDLGLLGRILVATEGINGTVSGTASACQKYMDTVRRDDRFADIVFKIDEVPGHTFQKMFVRVKEELVTFRADKPSNPREVTGTRLTPSEWKKRLEKGDAIVIDGRTDYEYDLGHFRNAIKPDCESFREFPEWIRKNLGDKKDAPILTYCTGGIRCEKLTAFMIHEGFTNVFQLDGGIVTYGKDPEVQGALWDGRCYVFDERISVPINHTEDRRIVGKCYHCSAPTERYINCANVLCNKQHLVCADCEAQFERACSVSCMQTLHKEMHDAV